MNAMRFRAKYVSASENGDYYQVAFENRDPASDAADEYGPDSPYLLIERQFEDPDGGVMGPGLTFLTIIASQPLHAHNLSPAKTHLQNLQIALKLEPGVH